ncbi:hypothetical protein NEMBOFW57_009385 [Staphylotrichum longicolle]|uniref:Uncharacterized protein n=1 Tax=Staphylotrichum longicolle TaxID=669026 RepID=A0AAD4ENZ1_9PEZI|nr:hypothetical protein NEMBOFW57_009385 [Staphylotrichum longicolle]
MKRIPRVKNKVASEQPVKTGEVKPKASGSQRSQAVKKGKAEQDNGLDPVTDDQAQPSITVASASHPSSVPTKAASRSRRPKAPDFYEIVDTSSEPNSESSSEPASESTPLPIDRPQLTPKVPWNLYGITDTASPNAIPEPATETKRNNPRPAKGETKSAEQGISHRNLSDLPLSRKETRRTAAAEYILIPDWPDPDLSLDPHDKLMSEDYIPLSPDAIPHGLQPRRGPKAKPRKQRLPPLSTSTTDAPRPTDAPKDSDTPEAAGTPFPSPTSPPLDVQQPPEADPAIWNLGTNPSPVHAIRTTPVCPGTVYCEACFRDEMARWTRIRDRVVRVLHLLGGDEALRELRVLGWEAEEAGKRAGC